MSVKEVPVITVSSISSSNDDADKDGSSGEGSEKRGEAVVVRKERLRTRLKDDVDRVFRRQCEPFIEPGALSRIHAAVRELLGSIGGPSVFKCFKEEMLPSGMDTLQQLMEDMKADSTSEQLVKAFATTWRRFFRGILPALDEIFFCVNAKPDESVRKESLMAFRDEVFIPFHENLFGATACDKESSDFKSVINMLLVLQSITGVCGQKGEVELVVSALIPSFFGKAAVTEDEEEEGQTLHFLSSKSWTNEMTNIAERRGSRQLLPQPKHLETLQQLVASAVRRKK